MIDLFNMPPGTHAFRKASANCVSMTTRGDRPLGNRQTRRSVRHVRFGSGMKGKVISSLVAGVPCVLTSMAAEGAHTSGEVVQRGQVSEIAPVAAKQYLAQVDQAVDGLLDRRDAPVRRPVAVFHPGLRP
jgi:hypothetical protein